MRVGLILFALLHAMPALAEQPFRHEQFSRFYAPTEMFLSGKRSVAAQYGLEKGAERSLDEFTRDDGDLSGHFSDFHLILTDEGQRLQIGAFFSSGANIYKGQSLDLMTLRETSIGNRTDYSIVGVDLASRFNETWSWALRMQNVRYTLRFSFDEFSGSFGATAYTAYSPTLAWQDGLWTIRLGYQPTINFVDRYPVRLPGYTRLSVLRGTSVSSWGLQILHHRERAIEKNYEDSYQAILGSEGWSGAWGWDTYLTHQTKAWKKAHHIQASTLARTGGGIGIRWQKSGDFTIGGRFETDRAPKVAGDSQGTRFEADLIQDTISLYVDYLIDAPKSAAVTAPPTP